MMKGLRLETQRCDRQNKNERMKCHPWGFYLHFVSAIILSVPETSGDEKIIEKKINRKQNLEEVALFYQSKISYDIRPFKIVKNKIT